MKFKLYHYWRSSSSWRVRWAMALKGLRCEYETLDLLTDATDSPGHLAKNPMGYVPVLEILDSDSNFRMLGESIAIIEYLDETVPTPKLIFGDALQKARIRQLAEIINAGTQPIQNLNVLIKHSEDPAEQKKWSAYWINKGLRAYETLIQESHGKYSMGDQISLADLVLIPQCYNALRFQVRLENFPSLHQIYKNAMATDACFQSAPERFDPKP